MKCPNCNEAMSDVKIESSRGVITSKQCSGCGSLWFDGFSFGNQDGSVKVNKSFDISKVKTLENFKASEIHCPNDHIKLKRFHDAAFPKNIYVGACTKCGGYWFNLGTFSSAENGGSLEKDELEKKLKEMMSEKNSNNKIEVLGRLSLFLSTAMYQNQEPTSMDLAVEIERVNNTIASNLFVVSVLMEALTQE